jgi:predicted extracellular nuclease
VEFIVRSVRPKATLTFVFAMLVALLPAVSVGASEHIFFSEIHYDNTGADTGEAIEVTAPAGMDMTGWSIVLYNGNGGAVYNTTSLNGVVPAGGAFSVSYPSNGIQNGDEDGFALIDASGLVVEFLSYEGVVTAVGGPANGMTSTDIGVSEPFDTPIGQSLQKEGEAWVGPQTSNFAGPLEVPVPQCDATELTLISSVQGPGSASPIEGQEVTVEGAVTAIYPELNGIAVQEEPDDVDGDERTSEGVFVFVGSGFDFESLNRFDIVQVSGEVDEFFTDTEISADEVAICETEPVEITATPLTLPADFPTREALEGMLVVTTQDLTVTSLFTAYSFGELGVSSSGILHEPVNLFEPGSSEAFALAEQNTEDLLFIDDRGEFGGDNSPWFGEPNQRAGDIVEAGVEGVLYFSFGDHLLEPIEFPDVVDGSPVFADREPAPSLDGGADIGAFNVLNYFNTFGNDDVLRGARNQEQFDLQSAKIVDAILNLDAAVLGLIEIENDYEDAFDGDPDSEPSIETLVDQLNAAAGSDLYDWITIPENLLTDEGLGGGGLGTDAIAVGIIYQPDRATPVGDVATFDIDALLTGADTNKNRWPLAASFDIDGQAVTVVVNHFKSKGSACDDVTVPAGFGDGQDDPQTASCDLVREYAAERLIEWVETKPTGVNSPDTFVVGDLNSYAEEDPIRILEEAGYLDLVERYDDNAFTYKFDGRYGRLDYIMASPSAKRLVDDAEVWQLNSAEPYGYLYFNEPIDESAYASSDHDAVVAAISEPGKGPSR